MSAEQREGEADAELDARFAEALDAFIAYIARVAGCSPETVRAYEGHIEAFGRWCARHGIDGLAAGCA